VAGGISQIRPAAVVLLAFVCAGVVALLQALQDWPQAAVIAPIAVLLVLRWARVPKWLLAVGILIGALIYPLFAAVGFAWGWANIGFPRIQNAWISWAVGAIVLGLAVFVYVRPWWLREPRLHPIRWAAGVVAALVLAPPFVFAGIALVKGDERSLNPTVAAVSSLDVVVLRPGADGDFSEERNVNGWHVRTWTGGVGSRGVIWGAGGPPPLVPSDQVDSLLLLEPGEGSAENDADRWLELADEVTPPSTPVYALLDTDDEAILERWRKAIRGGGSIQRRGDARELADFKGSGSQVALQLAALSRGSDQDLALAAKHRPALFFDSDDPDNTPLNVDRLIESGQLSLCEGGQGLQALCTAVRESADLHNGVTNLAFNADEVAKHTEGTTIYVNVTRYGNDHPNTIYLDYWWFLAHNPAGSAGGALCGPGFVFAGVTCFDHQSDWEGVTVVLDGDTDPPAPTAVSYAQHNHVIRYSWDLLQEAWDRHKRGERSFRARFAKRIDRQRPLVFSAKGSHASYPVPCFRKRCHAGGVLGRMVPKPLAENRHDGGRDWAGNFEENCRALCLTALPTRAGGHERARWNAFEGRWGTSTCVFGIGRICGSDKPPQSPGFQDRFRYPWCFNSLLSLSNGRVKLTEEPPCKKQRVPSRDELLSGERLLALGDSYSSGQGAGSYEPGTNGDGNTCYRSPLAWPQRLAARLDLRGLPSLACSGARIRHVTDDSKTGETERRRSQVGRISGDPARRPNVITITIGGNDAGFAKVLEKCILGDCKSAYDRPSGDRLEAAALEVGRRLPAVYRAIQGAAPGARLVVVDYPRLFPEDKPGGAVGNCAAWDRITQAEARYLNDSAQKLNAQIAIAAAAEGAAFIDVTDAFDGKELRCTGETYVNRFRAQSRLVPASFHPNAAGHARLAEVVEKALRELPGTTAP
jgi:lysophospholipase L1-like esterase